MDPYIDEIRAFGFNFAAQNWAFCNGQTLAIAQNQALFSIIGTIYGGDGQTTFQLPNLRGQVPMHWGTGPTNTTIGQVQGTSSVTLSTQQIPQHNHIITAAQPSVTSERSPAPTPTSYLGTAGNRNLLWSNPPANLSAAFSSAAISQTGSSVPHDNMQPYLSINFLIALDGIFPSRN